MKKIVNRIIAILPALILQVLWYITLYRWFEKYVAVINFIMAILAILFVLYIISKRDEATYKILWLLIILVFPISGAWLYFFLGNKKTVRPLTTKINKARKKLRPNNETPNNIKNELKEDNERLYQTMYYINQKTEFPIFYNESAKYYKIGEEMYEDMIEELKKAEKFIFLEYFIIEEGIFLNSIVEILEQKVKEGIDVRVMYDDVGSISTYSIKNIKKLAQKGIKCIPFNPIIFIKASLNNRDHRKMTIIDGKVAFSGGINIADEYINKKERFGHWKDIGFKITGDAVKSYTYMFIEFWNSFAKEKIPETYLEYEHNSQNTGEGFVLSYYDSPGNREGISNNLYIELLSMATKYAWFYTPYLLLGDSLMDAFIRAAQREVDVRIIVPGIPDKKIVYRLTKSYYQPLIEAGVKIYQYTPGFVHAKSCLIDDEIGTIGTVNLDYRSLFLHFENNSLFYKASMLKDLKQDFEDTQNKCYQVENKDLNKKMIQLLINSVLRIFAPLC